MPELSKLSTQERREAMSALADGRTDAAAAASALWAADADAREAWHTYHLIGDVLRSDDLAVTRGRDNAFLAQFRQRLAAEPVVLAPTARTAVDLPASREPRRWAAPAAVAAGFMAVAGVLVMTRLVAPGAAWETSPGLASSPASAVGGVVQARAPTGPAGATGDLQLQLVDGKLIRDARLDRYLRAHRGGAVAMPGGAIGRFETVVLER